jgi:hypothetical protein
MERMKNIIGVVVMIAALALLVVQHQKLAAVRVEAAKATQALNEAKAEAERAAAAPKVDPNEQERINQERAELVKLRAEVSALRKEKADWQKNRSAAESAALATQQRQAATNQTAAAQGMQWVETIMNGPAQVKGTETGNLRRKQLTGEPLNEAEQALLANMLNRAGEVEKQPEEFANFQSNFIGSVLGWNNDPRAEAVKGVLTAAMNAANQRGFDFHAPGENAEKWDENQKNLNKRATGAVQNMLKPEERALFDKAFIGVLGVDLGMGVTR